MSNLTRKDFLRLTSWSLIATLIPVDKISALSAIINNKRITTPNDFQIAQDLAKQAKIRFYERNYDSAQQLYIQAIVLAPQAIQFYDGLDNVYGAQNKFIESVELYKNGLTVNPNIVSFYDRAARALMRLETGHKSLASRYRNEINSSSLLNDAVALYNIAISIDSSKRYLHVGLQKVNLKISIAPLETEFKTNRVFKNLKALNKNSYKARINALSNDKIKELITRVDAKSRRELNSIEEIDERNINMILQKKKYYDILLKRQNLTDIEKTEISQLKFELDESDPNALRKLKVMYYSHNRFYDFIAVRKTFADKVKSFHSQIGVMDTIEVAFKKNQATYDTLEEAITIGNDLKNNYVLTEQQSIELTIKMSKILMLQQRFQDALNCIELKIADIHIVADYLYNKLIQFYAKVYYEMSNYSLAKNTLLIGLRELDENKIASCIQEYPNLEKINHLANNKSKNLLKDNLPLLYLLHMTYIKIADNMEEGESREIYTNKAIEVLNRLIENNPNDSFVLTRI